MKITVFRLFIWKHNISLRKLAKASTVDRRTLSRWINGDHSPRTISMELVLKALSELTGQQVTEEDISFEILRV